MLQIKNVSKQYKTGELVQQALNDVSLNLRDNEFVSILGPSGSGKTTLLNVIGGLDRYDSGDLIINGISTKDYKDKDWDAYRNHTIGFVFQSYNLIPHQTVLANVELALTIGGISRSERRRRAIKALKEVGLGSQLHKKPNQMSGGQMQRVASARAMATDPDILLADEPTGALDTETSVQVMELLKKVAKNRLVVMVTHNPELAEQYSTRIVRLRDGKIIDDSDPFTPEAKEKKPPVSMRIGKAKMGFFTSLALSFNNLKTKKGRTILTSFAGSIGIIGIALILALSTGVNTYISDVQKETMTSYPITIQTKTMDMSSLMGMQNQMMSGRKEEEEVPPNGIYADNRELQMTSALTSSITENDLTTFKQYLDDPDSPIQSYLGENGVVYSYDVKFNIYSYASDDTLVSSSADTEELSSSSDSSSFSSMMAGQEAFASMMGVTSSAGTENFSQLMAGANGEAVSPVVTDNYDLLYGSWPENYDETILILNSRNSIPTDVLYQLGLITADQYQKIRDAVKNDEEPEELRLDYSAVCDHTFYLLPACDRYVEQEDGTFADQGSTLSGVRQLLDDALPLKITGVVRQKDSSANLSVISAVGYTAKLTDYLIRHTDESPVVSAQKSDPAVNVLNGMEFEAPDDEKKMEEATRYLSSLGISEKANFYSMILYYQSSQAPTDPTGAGMMGSGMTGFMQPDESVMAAALDQWLTETPDKDILLSVYNESIAGSTYEENMTSFGKVSYDAPSSINIYTDSFEAKESVSDCIADYNQTVDEDHQITYTDYVKLMTSSLTSIVDVISYVLIAFVAVSLVVSCIMIGIITHISVLERTKEIGILRALGASKRNISQVFNAETIIIGFCAGFLGVGVSALLTLPINALIRRLLDVANLSARLPLSSAVILVILSVLITVLGGLLPAKKAAKKDPVIALRTE